MALHNGAMSDVTRILSQIESGDPAAASQLLPLVYDELRRLARQKLAHEKPGQTLQATALVHEAYVRLVGAGARGSELGVEGNRSDESPLAPKPESRSPSFSSLLLSQLPRRAMRHAPPAASASCAASCS